MSEIYQEGNRFVIYQPAKDSMQSGIANTKKWILEAKPQQAKMADPLMGWIGGASTVSQVKMTFDSLEAAIDFAQSKGYDYEVKHPKKRKLSHKSYADNFAFDKKESWTH